MAAYHIKQTKAFDLALLKEFYRLDKIVYSGEMAGNIASDSLRFKKVPESFLVLNHEAEVIGYMCFFPLSDEFFAHIKQSDGLYDNNIVPENMSTFEKGKSHHVFIISIVLDPIYQGKGLFKGVIQKFKDVLNAYHQSGIKIASLSGYAVSSAGSHILESLGCEKIKVVHDEEEGDAALYIANENQLKGVWLK